MQTAYDGRQVVGMDLHRRRSVLVRMTEDGPAALDEHLTGQFLAARRADGYAALRSARAVVPLLGYLRDLGAVLPPRMPAPPMPADLLAARFGEYLAQERAWQGKVSGVIRGWLAVSLPRRPWVMRLARRT